MRHRVLFRAGLKDIFCIPGFENVSPEDGSDCQTWVAVAGLVGESPRAMIGEAYATFGES